MSRNNAAALQVNGPVACLSLYVLYCSSCIGLETFGSIGKGDEAACVESVLDTAGAGADDEVGNAAG